jgi:transcriptional regulator with XRE-family HTH domain
MTLSKDIVSTSEGERVWHQERAIFEATEKLCELLESQEITRSRFAELLGKSKGYVSQLLDGEANMTLRTLSDSFLVLGRAVHITDGPLTTENDTAKVLRLHLASDWVEEEELDVRTLKFRVKHG